MSLLHKCALAVLSLVIALVLGLIAGYQRGKGTVQTITKEVKGDTKVEYKDRIVTVTRTVKPDGTVQETTKTEDRAGTSQTRTASKDSKTTPLLPNYAISASVHGSLDSPLARPDLGLAASMRLLGPSWVELGAVPSRKEVSIGVRVEL